MFFKKGHLEKVAGSKDRYQFTGTPSKKDLKNILNDPDAKYLQTVQNISVKTAELLDHFVFSKRPEIGLRVYGFIKQDDICDLGFCEHMPNLRHFYADCMYNAVNVDSITRLHNLKALSFGVFHHNSFDFLANMAEGLETLFIGETKSKNITMDAVRYLKELKHLTIHKQNAGIDAIKECLALEQLTLDGVNRTDLQFLTNLQALQNLKIHFGSIKNFAHLQECFSLKSLELHQIRSLSDLSFISSLEQLEKLGLGALRNVHKMPDMADLSYLHEIVLETMKGLTDLSSLENAPNLKVFKHFSAQNMQPEDYIPLLRNKSVTQIRVGLGGKKRGQELQTLASKYNKRVELL